MPNKRQALTFSELDQVQPKGRGAILRTPEEVKAEQRLLERQEPIQQDDQEPPLLEGEEDPTLVSAEQTTRIQSPKNTTRIDKQAINQASNHASLLARQQSDVIETIRKAVKAPGKEVSFVRLTQEEKSRLTDIVYTYKRQGKKTSENQINRIAINFILEDYHTNGDNSILAKVIYVLLA